MTDSSRVTLHLLSADIQCFVACRIRYYEYQVAVDFLAPSQQIPVATMFLINHRNQ
jgi:hypothetical protein